MNIEFEPVMTALFARLQAAVAVSFTADAALGDAALHSVSDLSGLFPGLPVFGPGVPRGALIQSVGEPDTLTLTAPVSVAATAASFKTGFLTTGRRVRHWNQVSDQPAMFLRRTGTTDTYSGEMAITTLECEIWIYSQAGKDPNGVPDTALSYLDQLVRQVFAPSPAYDGYRFTLDDLVYWCRIEGRSDYSPGDQSGQGISRIPVRITLP